MKKLINRLLNRDGDAGNKVPDSISKSDLIKALGSVDTSTFTDKGKELLEIVSKHNAKDILTASEEMDYWHSTFMHHTSFFIHKDFPHIVGELSESLKKYGMIDLACGFAFKNFRDELFYKNNPEENKLPFPSRYLGIDKYAPIQSLNDKDNNIEYVQDDMVNYLMKHPVEGNVYFCGFDTSISKPKSQYNDLYRGALLLEMSKHVPQGAFVISQSSDLDADIQGKHEKSFSRVTLEDVGFERVLPADKEMRTPHYLALDTLKIYRRK